jgi:hypothetical protein
MRGSCGADARVCGVETVSTLFGLVQGREGFESDAPDDTEGVGDGTRRKALAGVPTRQTGVSAPRFSGDNG